MRRLAEIAFGNLLLREFCERDGTAFQRLFCDIMDEAHGSEFQRVQAWGSDGDQKNDGFHRTTRQLFQCYAPQKLVASVAVRKLRDDFIGACVHWNDHFDEWVFVLNLRQDPPAALVREALSLEAAHAGKRIRFWGFQLVRQIVCNLKEESAARLLGPPVGEEDLAMLGYPDIAPLLAHLSAAAPAGAISVRPVPPGKLAANHLPPDVQDALTQGTMKSSLVARYFEDDSDPGRGERAASAFTAKYNELRDQGLAPEEIFLGLDHFAGGAGKRSPRHMFATWAVMAHFFESCDIFEEPRRDPA